MESPVVFPYLEEEDEEDEGPSAIVLIMCIVVGVLVGGVFSLYIVSVLKAHLYNLYTTYIGATALVTVTGLVAYVIRERLGSLAFTLFILAMIDSTILIAPFLLLASRI